MSYPAQNTLNGCITSLSTSVSLLNQSLNSLDAQMADFSRLGPILDQNRIFTVVPEHDVLMAKKSLVHEIEPRITRLVETIKVKVSKLERRASNLESKVQLNAVRINNFRGERGNTSGDQMEGTQEEMDRLKMLRLKRDRLKYKLSSINLQQRKARLSMSKP